MIDGEGLKLCKCRALTAVGAKAIQYRGLQERQWFSQQTDLQALATDPARQREGAATLLVKWAVRICDEKGSRAMVEASKDAAKYGLYSKQGFRTVDTCDYVDELKFPGFEGMYVVTAVREARQVEL